MKKVIFGTALASMALLSACSSDNELANVGTTANNAIGFHVVGNKAETRATPITPDNLTTTDFNVFAYKNNNGTDGEIFMGDKENDNHLYGVRIKYETETNKWVYNDQMNFATGQQLHLIFMRSIQAAQLPSLGILQIRKSK